MDRRSQAFGGIHGLSCISLWWHTWIVVHKHLVAYGAIYKPLVVYLDRCLHAFWCYLCGLQAFGGKWSILQTFGGIRGSPFTSICWQMEPFTSLWWYKWIVVYKPLVATSGVYKRFVADGVVYKPFLACVDCRSKALGGR